MAAFKKSDSNQIEMVMAGIMGLMLILIPVFFMLMWFGYYGDGTMTSAEMIITFGGGFLLIFIIMYFLKPENRYLCWLDVFLLLEVVSFILSTIFANSPMLAITGNEFCMEGTIINLVYLMLIFCGSILKNKKHRTCVYIALLLVGLFECFMGFMQTVVRYEPLWGGVDMADARYSAYGTLMNQNTYGAFVAIFAGLEFGLFITAKKKSLAVLHGILTILFTCCVMFSGTRGAMVGLGFTLVLYGIIVLVGACRKKEFVKHAAKRYGLAVLIAIIAVVVAILLSTETVSNTIERSTVETGTSVSSALNTVSSGRIGIWKKVFNKWLDDGNLITGLGVGNMKLVYISGNAIAMVFVAHNEYLDILACRGIFGLLTYLALMLYIFIFAMKKIFKNGIRNCGELFGLLIAFVAYIATAFFGWRIIYLTPYFYMVVGLIVPRDESKKILPRKK